MQNLIHALTRPALALIAALAAATCTAQETLTPWPDTGAAKRPYIFTQQHNMPVPPEDGGPRIVIRAGYPLQVQLPGNPALWSFVPEDSRHVAYLGRTMVYSPDRIPGTASLLVFDLDLAPEAVDGTLGQFTFATADLPASLDKVLPDGRFVVYFKVVDPG